MGVMALLAFELMVGAMLARYPGQVYNWRKGNFEIDYVYC